jgi:hypothetical protein
MAAMHVDDAFDDRKPKTGRAFTGGRFSGEPLEAAEQSPKIFGREACAFIGDADDGVFLLVIHQHSDLAADRTIFDGVADEIVDRLPHPVGIAHRNEIWQRRHRDGLLLVDGQRLVGIGDFVDQSRDIDRLAADADVEGIGHRV